MQSTSQLFPPRRNGRLQRYKKHCRSLIERPTTDSVLRSTLLTLSTAELSPPFATEVLPLPPRLWPNDLATCEIRSSINLAYSLQTRLLQDWWPVLDEDGMLSLLPKLVGKYIDPKHGDAHASELNELSGAASHRWWQLNQAAARPAATWDAATGPTGRVSRHAHSAGNCAEFRRGGEPEFERVRVDSFASERFGIAQYGPLTFEAAVAKLQQSKTKPICLERAVR